MGSATRIAGREPKEIVLTAPASASPPAKPATKLGAEHMLDFEAMQAVPDQLVTYFFWAEDIGPDGQPRRTSGDMFFAEVRHFEEIFRQGEQPPGGSAENEGQGGENAQEAGQLAELQKQIINGTWKLIRRETRLEADRRIRRGQQDLAGVAAGGHRAGGPAGRTPPRRGVRRPASTRPRSS